MYLKKRNFSMDGAFNKCQNQVLQHNSNTTALRSNINSGQNTTFLSIYCKGGNELEKKKESQNVKPRKLTTGVKQYLSTLQEIHIILGTLRTCMMTEYHMATCSWDYTQNICRVLGLPYLSQ